MIILGNGFFVPPSTDWQTIACPIESQAIVCEFRLFDLSLNWNDVKSFIYFRRSFKHLNLKINDNPIKCLPAKDTGIFTLSPIPLSLASQATESSLDVIKVFPVKNYTYNDPNWEVQFYSIL